MKVVFLTLLLGLVCAAQEEDAVDAAKSSTISELSGSWSTIYIASKNLEISKKVYFLEYIVFCNDCLIIIIFRYDSQYHVWRLLAIHAIRIGTHIYTYKHNGTNKIEFIHVSEKALVAINVNVDETGNKTEQVLLFGKDNDIDKEGLQKFKEEIEKRGISEENTKDLTKPDKCISVA